MNKEIAIKNLVDIQKAFPKGFLAYGSALGAHRDGDVIDHDLDTDFGIFVEDFDLDAIGELVRQGFRILHIFGMKCHGLELAMYREGVKTDLMIFYKDGDKYWNSLWENGCANGLSDEIRHEYKEDIFSNIEKIKIGENEFNYYGVKYIEAVYGEDWLVEVKEWNWRTDHKCLKKDE